MYKNTRNHFPDDASSILFSLDDYQKKKVAYCVVVFKYYPIVIARARICCIVVVCVLEAAVLPFFSFFLFFFFLINLNIWIELHVFQEILQVLKLTHDYYKPKSSTVATVGIAVLPFLIILFSVIC